MDKRIIIKKVKIKGGYKYILECLYCHNQFELAGYIFNGGQGFYCSFPCSIKARIGIKRKSMSILTKKKISLKAKQRIGEKANHWKGGRRYNNGYIVIYYPNHPFPNFQKKYVYEHRLIMEKILNKYLKPNERVHHLNGIKDDNRPENLILFSSSNEHAKFHNYKRKKNLKGQFI